MTEMQITLNQAEIETAIRRYVNDQVNIRDGHDVTIDLKAGRGPEGFTAIIDIVAVEAPPTTPAPSTPRVRVKTQPAPSQPNPETPVQTAQDAQEAASPEDATTPQDENQTDQAEPASPDPGGESEAEEGDQQEAASEKPRGSLFANLQKPRNS